MKTVWKRDPAEYKKISTSGSRSPETCKLDISCFLISKGRLQNVQRCIMHVQIYCIFLAAVAVVFGVRFLLLIMHCAHGLSKGISSLLRSFYGNVRKPVNHAFTSASFWVIWYTLRVCNWRTDATQTLEFYASLCSPNLPRLSNPIMLTKTWIIC